jgi:CheY-like chemotaxis protein
LQVVLRNSQHLSSLIDDVLDLSQIEAGQMAIKKEWVEVGEIVEAVSAAVRPLYKSKNLYLEINAPPDLPPIFCDRTRIREVLLNLLSNAGRFTETGGVTVRVWRESASIYFSVTDTGPGISEEDQQKLFQPFQQLDGSIRRKHGGTGLGLSISKSFVELHDGRMWVESQRGQGTTFSFCLPIEPVVLKQTGFARWLSPQWMDKTPRLTMTPILDARPHLLVVEKGKVLQRLLKRYLGEVAINAVADLGAARTALEKFPTCLVLVNDQQISETFEQTLAFAPLPYNPLTIACSIPEPTYYASTPDISEILIKPIARDTLLGALCKLKEPVRTILLVEDEPDAQRLFLRVLASANRGYQVLRANTGIQALDILSRREVDAILLDLILPEMDGFQFLRIKAQDKRLKDLPVIVISARDPQGHPIVSNFLAVTRGGGLSVQQLLAAIQALAGALVPNAPESALKQPGVLPG